MDQISYVASLRVQFLTESDAGTYTLVSSVDSSPTFSHQFHLTVNGKQSSTLEACQCVSEYFLNIETYRLSGGLATVQIRGCDFGNQSWGW